jgi:hypothetical protein
MKLPFRMTSTSFWPKTHSRFARRFQRRGRERFEIRSLRPGLQFRFAGRGAISNQRQQFWKRRRPRPDKFAKQEILSRSYTGASLRRQAHAFADDIVFAITKKKESRRRKSRSRRKARTATARFTFPISTAAIRRPSRTTTRLSPRPRGCRAGWRFITRSYRRATRTFFTTTFDRPAPDHRGIFRLEHGAAVSPDGSKVAMILSKERQPERVGVQRGRHAISSG